MAMNSEQPSAPSEDIKIEEIEEVTTVNPESPTHSNGEEATEFFERPADVMGEVSVKPEAAPTDSDDVFKHEVHVEEVNQMQE